MHNNKKMGFTLIELMIVIAIIAILMAFAVPAYRSYIVKTKAGEGISMTSSLKSAVTLIWMENNNLAGANSGSNGILAPTNYVGAHVSQIAVNTGEITVTYINDPLLVGETLTMSPLLPGVGVNTGQSLMWQCTSTLDDSYLPGNCQTP